MESGLNWGRASPDSALGRLLRRARHPGAFICGLRWPEADDPKARNRWRYRPAWVDPWPEGDALTVHFADQETLRIRLDADPWWHGGGPAARPLFAVLSGRSADAGARLLVAVPQGELIRFGVGGL